MKAQDKLPWTIITALVLLAGLAWIWLSRSPQDGTTAGKIPAPQKGFLAPDFTLPDSSGTEITLSELRGRPVLLNIWASWCPACRAEMPAMQRTYQDYSDQGFTILAVNAADQDNMDDAISFVEGNQLTFPILFDTDGRVSRLYQVRAMPTSFFIDSDGIIQEVVVGGPMSEALLRIRVEQLIENSQEER